MDAEFIMYFVYVVCAVLLIFFAMFVIGSIVAFGSGIIAKTFDFYTDIIAGKESTDFEEDKDQ